MEVVSILSLFYVKLIYKNYLKTNSSVGIDLGIKDIAILSTGEKIENLKFSKQLEDKLKREQRKLSKKFLVAKKSKKKLSEAKNYQKQRTKVAKIHEKL